jgi:hypothetical protein
MATKKKAAKASKPKTYKGKSMKVGGGGQFAKMQDALMAKGMSKDRAGAITAAAGRKKYGKAKFQKMAVIGRKRAAAKKK